MPSVNGYYSFADAKNALNFISYWAGMSERTFKSVGCMGFSAGGHLAGYITHLHYEEETSVRPDWMALIYPVISLTGVLLIRDAGNVFWMQVKVNIQPVLKIVLQSICHQSLLCMQQMIRMFQLFIL